MHKASLDQARRAARAGWSTGRARAVVAQNGSPQKSRDALTGRSSASPTTRKSERLIISSLMHVGHAVC
jgi:hypothetical protein